ncbi:MAG: hypothetical protein RI911_477 [Candidatus Parcubacteria bacterium]|jgi:UDP-N-acetylmuramoyl-tripeptide--D-alanyl-D-alanine ligase
MQSIKSICKRLIVWLLTLEARLLLHRHKPKIAAVTGSVGKTSTKDAVFSVLSGTYRVRKSDKSYNSDIGVPLTILGLRNPWNNPLLWAKALYEGFVTALFQKEYPEWLVLEVGADHPGDIRRIAKWLKPDIAVLTAVPNIPVHVEFFPSPDAVLAEKRHLIDAVVPGGVVIIDGDCEKTAAIAKHLKGNVYTFGYDDGLLVRVSEAAIVYDDESNVPEGMEYEFVTKGNTYCVEITDMLGAHLALPIAVAIAIGEHLGIPKDKIEERLSIHETPQGRMRIIKGEKETILIDDTYNASPYATEAALAAIRDLEISGKRIAILGDMSELGKHTGDAHNEVGASAKSIVDRLITIGARARGIAEGARTAGMDPQHIHEFSQGDWDSVVATVRKYMEKGDVILVKGSQSVRLERAVVKLLHDASDANKLVRQDAEWKNR